MVSIRFVVSAAVVAAAVFVLGCSNIEHVQCSENTHCDLASGGACRAAPTGNQWCAYPDSSCPSGERWSDFDVGDGISGQCVGDERGADAGVDGPVSDGNVGDDAMVSCEPSTTTCENDVTVVCDSDGEVIAMEECNLGCHPTEPRCWKLDPSNELESALQAAQTGPDLVLSDGSTIDTVTGVVVDGETGIEQAVPTMLIEDAGIPVPVRVLMMRSLVAHDVVVTTGTSPEGPALAIVSHGTVEVRGVLDVSGRRGAFNSENGPGAMPSGDACHGESGERDQCFAAGGGGGRGGLGKSGFGGDAGSQQGGAPGTGFAQSSVIPLAGGCRGSTGGAGGAVQIVSADSIRITSGGGIQAGGAGGTFVILGSCQLSGGGVAGVRIAGGGGSGGAILLEAPAVNVESGAALAANGGGGACGFEEGEPGRLDATPAAGGNCVANADYGNGGAGGALGVAGMSGEDVPVGEPIGGGGGGGSVGRIRINTSDGTYTADGTISPSPSAGVVVRR